MTSRSRLLGLTLSALLCVGLTACGDGAPTADDVRAAQTKKFKADGKDPEQIKTALSAETIGKCTQADTGYMCDVTHDGQTEKLNLIKDNNGWSIAN